MKSVVVSDTQIWYIAHNGIDIFHHGVAQEGQEIAAGLPNIELFDSYETFIQRCDELGIEVLEQDGTPMETVDEPDIN